MKPITNSELRQHFLGWQCRIRQIAMRDYGGQPMPGMRPRVSRKNGELLSAGVTVLLIPNEPRPSTAYFRFQVQKTIDPKTIRDAGLTYLSGEFYQLPDGFSDELTAVFSANSPLATEIVKSREVVLDFEQWSQSFRMFCRARKLADTNGMRDASLWQARLFNPNLPNEATVIGLKPDWKTAQARQSS